MPALVRYMLSNFTIGFLIGSAAAIALIVARQAAPPATDLITLWLQIFSLGAPFGMGFLGTALMLDAEQ